MNKEDLEYNERQINLMQQKILNFLENKIYIDWLITDLEALTECLKQSSREWIKAFNALTWDLEIIYACALEENKKYFSVEEEKKIEDILNKMKDLIDQYKKENFVKKDLKQY